MSTSYDDYGVSESNGQGRNGSVRGPPLSIDVSNANRGRVSPAQQRKLDPRAAQAQTARDYEVAKAEADAQAMMEDDSAGSSGDEVAEGLRVRNGEGMEGEGGDDGDDSGSFSDSLSSSPSIPDEDIDFSLVYALHTFLATVDGQASVVKGDKLLLLDDSNSYWWLVRVLKTQAVGYIPAENIETPFERLARLNKHRNVDLTSATQHDVVTGPSSTAAQTRFGGRIPPSQQPHPHQSQHPSAKGITASPSHKDHPRNISPGSDRPERSTSSKAKTVIFTAPTYYEHSANGDTEEEYDEEMDEGEEGEMQGEQVFDDDDVESEFSDDNLTEDADEDTTAEILDPSHVSHGPAASHLDEGNDGGDEDDHHPSQNYDGRARDVLMQHAAMNGGDWQRQDHGITEQQERAISPLPGRSMSPQQQLHLQQQQRQDLLQRQQVQEQQQQRQQEFDEQQQRQANFSDSRNSSIASRLDSDPGRRPSDLSTRSEDLDREAPTKKFNSAPPIVRDLTFDINNPFGDLPGGVSGRAPSPIRVRGVEVVDPKDPRYQRLISDRRPPRDDYDSQRRPSGDSGYENDMSFNSIDTGSSIPSVIAGSDDGRASSSPVSPSGGKKLKKGRESVDGEGEKKRKSGGILGLFRKKDKKKKEKDDGGRSSEESARVSSGFFGRASPTSITSGDGQTSVSPARDSGERAVEGRRESQTAESMFSTDAALRQQQVEAKQALYHQYGVQRAPGDVSNTMTPRNNSLAKHQQNLNPGATNFNGSPQTAQRMRPGSLIGSPSVSGLDVPLLSVLRMFAGDNIESDATFKTVLLNKSTTSSDLVKQAMQRFRLAGIEERDEYYLTVKEVGGDERLLADDQKPLVIFEALSDASGGSAFVPSVKRSSIGSINSIASNLSLNPAITRLGMNDFTDDSAVKFYLNRRPSEHPSPTLVPEHDSQAALPVLGALSSADQSTPVSSPGFRFAVRLLIFPDDLPENVVFDPQSNAIIPKSVLLERQQRSGLTPTRAAAPTPREKIVFFPRNATVSEVIEAALDRFGIVDGVVDGGDEVEDRVSRRRSISRVKYGLAVVVDDEETLLHSSSKILDAYRVAPLLKSYDRSSKEFRRRSVDATLILGSPQDISSTDPVFVIRRVSRRLSTGPRSPALVVDELSSQQNRQAQGLLRPDAPSRSATAASAASGMSVYETPSEELPEEALIPQVSPQATRQEIIAAQRATSRANQRAVLSAQKNADQGVDILLPDRGTIRSSRSFANDRVRYSYIDQDGTEMDISEIVETEWATSDQRSASRESQATVSGVSTDDQSFRSAETSPVNDRHYSHDEDEDTQDEMDAVSSLRSAAVMIDGSAAPTSSTVPQRVIAAPTPVVASRTQGSDFLEDALGTRSVTSPMFNESLQDRLDRVLAKVREDRTRGGPRSRSQQSFISGPSNGRASPITPTARSPSPASQPIYRSASALSQGRKSPFDTPQGRASPLSQSIAHTKKSSVASVGSSAGTANTDPSTPLTGDSNARTFTPQSSSGSPRAVVPVYRDNFGLDTLMALVDGHSFVPSRRPVKDVGVDGLFGHSLKDLDLNPEVKGWYQESSKSFDDIDARLDALLLSVVQH